MKKILFSLLIVVMTVVHCFAYLPSYKYTIQLNNTGTALTNYKMQFTFSGAIYIGSGNLQANFNDIRFSTQSTCPTTFLNHYVESVTAGNGKIWVNIPTFAVGANTIYMYFGDATASNGSNFAATFPNSFIAPAGSSTLTGTHTHDWFEVPAGSTVDVTQSTTLTINASRIKIAGTINALGKGNVPTGLNSNGTGTGGGTQSAPQNSGAGGGSYGGVGGTGGYDAGDTPGVGGPTYGTASGNDVAYGSAGGSSQNTLGGNGGGIIILNSTTQTTVTSTGLITVAGGNATTPGSSFGAGGGSGGCIFLTGDYIEVLSAGTVTAAGGNGSTGVSTANDSGGGGGGGRIKIKYGISYNNAGIVIASGGIGGPNGGAAPGQNGGTGTTSTAQVTPKASFTTTNSINTIICFALPVHLVSFTAKKVNSSAVLNWVTTDEKNNLKFVIQRSTNSIDFTDIGEVAAQNLLTENDYSFVDNSPVPGVNYYRLKQVDISGQYEFSDIRNLLFNQENVSIYPNPTKNELNIVVKDLSTTTDAILMNQMGQELKKYSINNAKTTLQIGNLAQGIYFILLQGKMYKIVKE